MSVSLTREDSTSVGKLVRLSAVPPPAIHAFGDLQPPSPILPMPLLSPMPSPPQEVHLNIKKYFRGGSVSPSRMAILMEENGRLKNSKGSRRENIRRIVSSVPFILGLLIAIAITGGVLVSILNQLGLALPIDFRMLAGVLLANNLAVRQRIHLTSLINSTTSGSVDPTIHHHLYQLPEVLSVLDAELGYMIVLDSKGNVVFHYYIQGPSNHPVPVYASLPPGGTPLATHPDPVVQNIFQAASKMLGKDPAKWDLNSTVNINTCIAPLSSCTFSFLSPVYLSPDDPPLGYVLNGARPFSVGVFIYPTSILISLDLQIVGVCLSLYLIIMICVYLWVVRPFHLAAKEINRCTNVDEINNPRNVLYQPTHTEFEKTHKGAREASFLATKMLRKTLAEDKFVVPKEAEFILSHGRAQEQYNELESKRQRGTHKRFWQWFDRNMLPTEVREIKKAVHTAAETLKFVKPFVPTNIVYNLLMNNDSTSRTLVDCDLSLHFCDIENYTAITEQLRDRPAVFFAIINEYYSELSTMCERSFGTVDKWMGDCIMAFYGAPISVPKHAAWAVHASFLYEMRLRDLNKVWRTQDVPHIRVRHGFHTGDVRVGQFGSSYRVAYTALGDTVNLASRLESANKRYGTIRLCTHDMYLEIKDYFVCRHMEDLVVAGKSKPVGVYEIMGYKVHPENPVVVEEIGSEFFCTRNQLNSAELYSQATHEFTRQNFSVAEEIYTQYKRYYCINKEDKACDLMLAECAKRKMDPEAVGFSYMDHK